MELRFKENGGGEVDAGSANNVFSDFAVRQSKASAIAEGSFQYARVPMELVHMEGKTS